MTESSDEATAEQGADRVWAAAQLEIDPPPDEAALPVAMWRSLATRKFQLTPTQHVAADILQQRFDGDWSGASAACKLADQEQQLRAEIVAEADQFFQRSPYVRRALWERLRSRVAHHPRLEHWTATWRAGLKFDVATLSELQRPAFHRAARVWLAAPMDAAQVAREVANEFVDDPVGWYDQFTSLLPVCDFLEPAINRCLRELPSDDATRDELAEFAGELRNLHTQPGWQLSQTQLADPLVTRYRSASRRESESSDGWLKTLSPILIIMAFAGLRLLLTAERSSKMSQFDRPLGQFVAPQIEKISGLQGNPALVNRDDFQLRLRIARYGLLELKDNPEASLVSSALAATRIVMDGGDPPRDFEPIYRVLGEGPQHYLTETMLRKMNLHPSIVTIYQSTSDADRAAFTSPDFEGPISALEALQISTAGEPADE